MVLKHCTEATAVFFYAMNLRANLICFRTYHYMPTTKQPWFTYSLTEN